MNTQEENDKQAKPVKRVLTKAALRHLPGMVVQTGIKGGKKAWTGPKEEKKRK